ncbi:hypothetical protein NDU88_005770 [Pleurodeles waltl]|uniref:Uncharacterized protein n=1 Tax=Pleurodeles waltl TaxID=8319 RepID=A0AAV7RPY0_PLEWA|nr:hypothetical protein NDU88_005770 [Pleurodeles waltl]
MTSLAAHWVRHERSQQLELEGEIVRAEEVLKAGRVSEAGRGAAPEHLGDLHARFRAMHEVKVDQTGKLVERITLYTAKVVENC